MLLSVKSGAFSPTSSAVAILEKKRGRISGSTITETCSFGLNHALPLPLDLSCGLQEWLTGKDLLGRVVPPSPDNSLLIYKEVCTPRDRAFRLADTLKDTVTVYHLEVWIIAQKWVRQLHRVGERLLGEGVVCADPEYLDVQLLELLIVDLPGRQVLRSRRAEIVGVKLEENVLPPPELAQAYLFSGCTW